MPERLSFSNFVDLQYRQEALMGKTSELKFQFLSKENTEQYLRV